MIRAVSVWTWAAVATASPVLSALQANPQRATAMAAAQQPATSQPGRQAPVGTQPGAPAPVPPQGPAGVQGALATPPAPAPAVARVFSAPAGLLFNTVRPERVTDFERVIGYLQAAFEKSTDPTVQAQASGWRIFKASEPGPNNTVMYVFVINPAVAAAEYGLGRILAEAYPEPAQLQEIWKLYTGAVTGGGTLLNLTPVQAPPPGEPGVVSTPAATPAGPRDLTPLPPTQPAAPVSPAPRTGTP